MHRPDYVYASPCPEKLKTRKQSRDKNPNSNNQTYLEYTRKHKPTLNKQIIT